MSKVIKIALTFLASILGLLLLLWGLAQTELFQSYLAKKISTYFTEELKTEVSIKSLKVKYFDHLELGGVLVRDLQNDTMFYVDELDADYDLWEWTQSNIVFDKITLKNSKVNIGIHEGQSDINLQFIIDYTKPAKPNPDAVAPFIVFDRVLLENVSFNYFDGNIEEPTSRAFKENDFLFYNIYGDILDFNIIEDSISFQTIALSANEKSGLRIDDLQTKAIISRSKMEYKELLFKTPNSQISDYLLFEYSSYQDFAKFIDKVMLTASLKEAKIHTKDLVFFSDNLKPYDDLISASGDVKGLINNIKGVGLNLAIGETTSFRGDAQIRGIPEMDDSYWDVASQELKITALDLGKYLQLDEIPSELLSLGQIAFKGQFNGFINEFVCYGDLSTDLGVVTSDVKFKVNPAGKEIYSGNISSKKINLLPLLDYKQIGEIGFDFNIDGEGIAIENLNTNLNGKVFYLDFNNHRYSNIYVNGNLKEDIFNGNAGIDDADLKAEFNGIINASATNPFIDVKADARQINLKTLGLDDQESILSFTGDLNLKGQNIDDLVGTVKLDSLQLIRNKNKYPVKQLTIVANGERNNRMVHLSSDILTMDVSGKFNVTDLDAIALDIMDMAYPYMKLREDKERIATKIKVSARIPKFHPVFKEYLDSVSFSSLSMNLNYDSDSLILVSKGIVSSIVYDDFFGDYLSFEITKPNSASNLVADLSFGKINYKDSLIIQTMDVKTHVMKRRFEFLLDAYKDSSLSANIDAYLTANNDSFEVFINSAKARVNNKDWQMKQTDFANIVYHNSLVELFYFDFRNKDEILFFDAAFGPSSRKVNLVLDDFLLDNLNPFFATTNTALSGTTNGYLDLKYVGDYPIVESNIVVQSLSVNDNQMGDLLLSSYTNDNPLKVFVEGKLEKGLFKSMDISGDVDFSKPQNALNLLFETKDAPIDPFALYLEGLASNVSGKISAKLKVTGELMSPTLKGEANFEDLKFKIDYLGTTYAAKAKLDIGDDYFRLKEASLTDRFGQKGDVYGAVRHSGFSEFQFDMRIDNLSNFECMNTTRKDNELFYGKAFADGSMKITGPLDDILLEIDAKSRKGTKVYIPLDYVEHSSQLSYVQFVNLKADNDKVKEPLETTDGVKMDFNFQITNDAEVELIFDELLGDKIKGTGHGNIRLEVDTYGEFNMYGKITIDRGGYLFTAFNFINKYFSVTPGGTLTWDGDPYNATIELDATKREYAQPLVLMEGLITEDEEAQYSDPIPVDCHLKLTGTLFNPDISFGLSFPSSSNLVSNNSAFSTVIQRIENDPEELNRQVFALLALGTFIPPSFSNNSGIYSAGTGIQNSVNNSISDFFSSQLSNWLSQIDPKVQVGVDYQGATDLAKAELVLSLKKKWINDRLETQVSYEASSTTGSRPYDLNLQFDLSKDGSLKVKGFQRNANDPTLGNLSNVTTSGIGFFYRHQFDSFRFKKKIVPDSSSN